MNLITFFALSPQRGDGRRGLKGLRTIYDRSSVTPEETISASSPVIIFTDRRRNLLLDDVTSEHGFAIIIINYCYAGIVIGISVTR